MADAEAVVGGFFNGFPPDHELLAGSGRAVTTGCSVGAAEVDESKAEPSLADAEVEDEEDDVTEDVAAGTTGGGAPLNSSTNAFLPHGPVVGTTCTAGVSRSLRDSRSPLPLLPRCEVDCEVVREKRCEARSSDMVAVADDDPSLPHL